MDVGSPKASEGDMSSIELGDGLDHWYDGEGPDAEGPPVVPDGGGAPGGGWNDQAVGGGMYWSRSEPADAMIMC